MLRKLDFDNHCLSNPVQSSEDIAEQALLKGDVMALSVVRFNENHCLQVPVNISQIQYASQNMF